MPFMGNMANLNQSISQSTSANEDCCGGNVTFTVTILINVQPIHIVVVTNTLVRQQRDFLRKKKATDDACPGRAASVFTFLN